MFLFGLTAADVSELRARGYNPWNYYNGDPELKASLDMIADGTFSPGEPHRYGVIRDALLSGGDHYLLLADYRAYVDKQSEIDRAYRDQDSWTRKAVINVAHMGPFSGDRAIHEYAEKVWRISGLA
jgi:starch phosphorylase